MTEGDRTRRCSIEADLHRCTEGLGSASGLSRSGSKRVLRLQYRCRRRGGIPMTVHSCPAHVDGVRRRRLGLDLHRRRALRQVGGCKRGECSRMTHLTARFSSLDRSGARRRATPRQAAQATPRSHQARRVRQTCVQGTGCATQRRKASGPRWPAVAFRMRCAACPMDTHRAARRACPESHLEPSNGSLLSTLGITRPPPWLPARASSRARSRG